MEFSHAASLLSRASGKPGGTGRSAGSDEALLHFARWASASRAGDKKHITQLRDTAARALRRELRLSGSRGSLVALLEGALRALGEVPPTAAAGEDEDDEDDEEEEAPAAAPGAPGAGAAGGR